jgi:TRAP-type C4-dicarboxylate transport system permease large subunit
MSVWCPRVSDSEVACRRQTGPSPIAALFRVTVLGLATAGQQWLPATLDATIPPSAALAVNGAAASRDSFADVFLGLYAPNVIFHDVGEVEAESVCSKVSVWSEMRIA